MMPVTVRMPGWPVAVVDTPDEQVARRKQEKAFRLSQPVLYETAHRGLPARIRGSLIDGELCGYACEWLCQGIWREILSAEVRAAMKEEFERERCR